MPQRASVSAQPETLVAKCQQLLRDFERRQVNPTIKAEVERLPVFSYRAKILQTIESNQVVIVSAETGSGKTTQVPQFILDSFIAKSQGSSCNIIVTQPRRISAISVALRVSLQFSSNTATTLLSPDKFLILLFISSFIRLLKNAASLSVTRWATTSGLSL